jgi:hypothetical protein
MSTHRISKYPISEQRLLGLICIWSLLVHVRSVWIWFDWETVRFFVQPRPGRFRLLEAWTGGWIDLTDYGINVASATWRPLMATLFQLEAWIFSDQSWGYHLINLGAHLCCVVLVFILGKRWGMTLPGRVAASLIFATHPLSTQPMWILGDRAEQFVLLGGLMALYWYGRRILPAMAGCALALLSKETAVTIPLWLAAADLIFFRSDERFRESIPGRIRRQWPFWVLLAGYLLVRNGALGGIGGYGSASPFCFDFFFDIAGWNIAWLMTMAEPFPWIWIAGLIVPVLVCLPISSRVMRMGTVWGVIFLIPVHNLCNKWYLYTPLAAVAFVLGGVVDGLNRRGGFLRSAALVVTLSVCVCLSLMSVAELSHQGRNAAVPLDLAERVHFLHPTIPSGHTIRFELPRNLSQSTLRGHWFDPSTFVVKSQKSPEESIVWDLNATRYLVDGTPVWTRSVEAAIRLIYDDISLRAVLSDSLPITGIPPDIVRVPYDPESLFEVGR